MKLFARTRTFLFNLAVAIDQLGQTVFVGGWWCLTGRGKQPDPDETISAYVGRGELRGRMWGRFFAAIIDTLFFIITLGGERDHCLRAAVREMSKRGF